MPSENVLFLRLYLTVRGALSPKPTFRADLFLHVAGRQIKQDVGKLSQSSHDGTLVVVCRRLSLTSCAAALVPQKSPITICITGAAGQIGYALLPHREYLKTILTRAEERN
jgi:hypothetical protein